MSNIDFQVCKTCDQVKIPKPVIYCPKYVCSIDGREVNPYDCCALWGNDKAEEAEAKN